MSFRDIQRVRGEGLALDVPPTGCGPWAAAFSPSGPQFPAGTARYPEAVSVRGWRWGEEGLTLMLQPPWPREEAWLKLVTWVTLPSRAGAPGPLMWAMVFLPPLLVLTRVGGARSPSVSSGRGERGYCRDQVR